MAPIEAHSATPTSQNYLFANATLERNGGGPSICLRARRDAELRIILFSPFFKGNRQRVTVAERGEFK